MGAWKSAGLGNLSHASRAGGLPRTVPLIAWPRLIPASAQELARPRGSPDTRPLETVSQIIAPIAVPPCIATAEPQFADIAYSSHEILYDQEHLLSGVFHALHFLRVMGARGSHEQCINVCGGCCSAWAVQTIVTFASSPSYECSSSIVLSRKGTSLDAGLITQVHRCCCACTFVKTLDTHTLKLSSASLVVSSTTRECRFDIDRRWFIWQT